jgi:Tfp pilus assembly protein FimT
MLTVAVASVLAGIAVPALRSVDDATKLSNAAQQVERELQTARMRAVSNNTPLRFRTNCPSSGYFRITELLGTVSDGTTSRCSISSYPWPATDTDLATVPNHDGALRQMLNSATVSDAWVEFHPDGTAWQVTTNTAAAIAANSPVTITVTRNGSTKTITVNELGKVKLQ